MSVNSMDIVDIRQVLNSVFQQATGHASIAPTSTYEFVSMANTALAAGTDKVYGALMGQITKTVFAVRPYDRKFKGLLADNERWGAITRKISFADRDLAFDEKVFHPIDGQSVDHWVQHKADPVEMRYYGADAYQDVITIYEDQLYEAFTSEAALGSFLTAQMQNMSNKWEQYLENLSRAAMANFIGAKAYGETDLGYTDGVVHLLTEYNTDSGQNLSATDIYQEAYMAAFFRWARARVNTLARDMAERSELFQFPIAGKQLNRHTPAADLKIYLSAPALDKIDTMVNTVTYHDEPLAYADTEGVNYWQSIKTKDEVQVDAGYIDAAGLPFNTGNVTVSPIFGLMFDRDAIITNIRQYNMANTPLNARGRYYNTWLTALTQYCNDLTEKGVLLLLD